MVRKLSISKGLVAAAAARSIDMGGDIDEKAQTIVVLLRTLRERLSALINYRVRCSFSRNLWGSAEVGHVSTRFIKC